MTLEATSAAVRLERAHALIELGRFDQAVAALRAILAVDPSDALAWCLLAQAHLGGGDAEAALTAARTATSLTPADDWPPRLACAALLPLNRSQEAVQAAREAVRLGPHNSDSFVLLAMALTRTEGALGEAREAADQALRLAPDRAGPHRVKGLVAMSEGRYEEAQACLVRALEIDPHDSVAHNDLAIAQLKLADSTNAKALAVSAGRFATALQADPDAEVSRRNLDLVIRLFLERVSYLVFLVAFVIARTAAHAGQPAARVLPVLVFAFPVVYSCRFVNRLAPELRSYLAYQVFRGSLRAPAILNGLAVLGVLIGALAPQGARPALAAGAALAALASRVFLWQAARTASRHSTHPHARRPLTAPAMATLTLCMAAVIILPWNSDHGQPRIYNVVDAGQELVMPGYSARVLAARVATDPRSDRASAEAGMIVAYQLAITNRQGTPLAFDPSALTELLIPARAGQEEQIIERRGYPVQNPSAPSAAPQFPPIPPGQTRTTWIRFFEPISLRPLLTARPASLQFLATDGATHFGRIRLWKAATQAGQYTVTPRTSAG